MAKIWGSLEVSISILQFSIPLLSMVEVGAQYDPYISLHVSFKTLSRLCIKLTALP